MSLAILTIGTSTTRVNLLDPNGFLLSEWRPQALGENVTERTSALADGSRPVDYQNLDIIDTFELKLKDKDADATIRKTQVLRQLGRAALDYWKPTAQVDTPLVYMEARAKCETNSRYCIVKEARMVEDDNPYRQPFAGKKPVMDNLALVVKHGPWQDQVPGESGCVQVSGIGVYSGSSQEDDSFVPTASADDAYVASSNIYSASNDISFGNVGGTPYSSGVRFRNVTIPQGATIVSAFVVFQAYSSLSGDDCNAIIYGEDDATPAIFSTLVDFWARARTSAYVPWDELEVWTLDHYYETPDISAIIEEIVALEAWVPGNDLVVFVQDNGSDTNAYRAFYAIDDPAGDEAELFVFWTMETNTYGRAATCENEVYFNNKQNQANLTNVYTYGAVAGWAANLVAVSAYNLFVAAPANGDFAIFGIDSTLVDSGPFASLVFDISSILTPSGGASITWQYWNGAWTTIPDLNDNTDTGGGPFTILGVNSVHWPQPNDWATLNLNAHFGGAAPNVTGYWVRAVVALGAGAIAGPATQQNREVYSITWPYVEMAAAQVGGDIPALARLLIEGQASQGGGSYGPSSTLSVHNVVIGERKTERGENFTAYLNAAPDHPPSGCAVFPYISSAAVADTSTPTGQKIRFTAAAAESNLLRVDYSIYAPVVDEWIGTYHAYMRVKASVADNFTVQLTWGLGWGGAYHTSSPVSITSTLDWYLVDFGKISIPPPSVLTENDTIDVAKLLVYASAAAAGTLDFYDLILIPADECLCVMSSIPAMAYSLLGTGRVLEIDSIINPKRVVRSMLRVVSTNGVTAIWTPRTAGPLTLQSGKQQRLWFLTFYAYYATNLFVSEPSNANSIQAFSAQRYFSMRGDQ